jgi:hypothetical protein
MRKRKFIGFMTVLTGLPGLGALLLFTMSAESSIGFIALILVAVVLRGVCGVVGGVLIWKGNKLGYYFSAVTWLYLVVIGSYTVIQLHTNPVITPSFDLNQFNHAVYLKPLSTSLGKIIWGIPFIAIIFRDLYKTSKSVSSLLVETEN